MKDLLEPRATLSQTLRYRLAGVQAELHEVAARAGRRNWMLPWESPCPLDLAGGLWELCIVGDRYNKG
jgi:hypothetical protein